MIYSGKEKKWGVGGWQGECIITAKQNHSFLWSNVVPEGCLQYLWLYVCFRSSSKVFDRTSDKEKYTFFKIINNSKKMSHAGRACFHLRVLHLFLVPGISSMALSFPLLACSPFSLQVCMQVSPIWSSLITRFNVEPYPTLPISSPPFYFLHSTIILLSYFSVINFHEDRRFHMICSYCIFSS